MHPPTRSDGSHLLGFAASAEVLCVRASEAVLSHVFAVAAQAAADWATLEVDGPQVGTHMATLEVDDPQVGTQVGTQA